MSSLIKMADSPTYFILSKSINNIKLIVNKVLALFDSVSKLNKNIFELTRRII